MRNPDSRFRTTIASAVRQDTDALIETKHAKPTFPDQRWQCSPTQPISKEIAPKNAPRHMASAAVGEHLTKRDSNPMALSANDH